MKSITRKFFIKNLPDLSDKHKDYFERYYLFINKFTVIRVQKVNEYYELERKINESDLIRDSESIQITKEEFDGLKNLAKHYIKRDSYQFQENPEVAIRVYHGNYEGLQRVEVKFQTIEESQEFIPFDWFGREITNTPLVQDGQLLQLTKEEFKELLK